MKIVDFYSPPYAEVISKPDLRLIQILILYVDAEYWTAGPGQAWFDYRDNDKNCQLILTFHTNHGFHVRYEDEKSIKVSLGESGDYEHSVKTYVGGDPWILPTKFFVTREQTWQAVEEFCTTGNRTDVITWGDNREIKWHYGYE